MRKSVSVSFPATSGPPKRTGANINMVATFEQSLTKLCFVKRLFRLRDAFDKLRPFRCKHRGVAAQLDSYQKQGKLPTSEGVVSSTVEIANALQWLQPRHRTHADDGLLTILREIVKLERKLQLLAATTSSSTSLQSPRQSQSMDNVKYLVDPATMYQDEITSLSRQVSHLQTEREKMIVAQRASSALHTKEQTLLRIQLKQAREEASEATASRDATDRMLKASEAKCFALRDEVKRLEHQSKRTSNDSHRDTGSAEDSWDAMAMDGHGKGKQLLVFKTRKEQAKAIQEASSLRHQIDALRHELYKEKLNRSREQINTQATTKELHLKIETLEATINDLNRQLGFEKLSKSTIEQVCNEAFDDLSRRDTSFSGVASGHNSRQNSPQKREPAQANIRPAHESPLRQPQQHKPSVSSGANLHDNESARVSRATHAIAHTASRSTSVSPERRWYPNSSTGTKTDHPDANVNHNLSVGIDAYRHDTVDDPNLMQDNSNDDIHPSNRDALSEDQSIALSSAMSTLVACREYVQRLRSQLQNALVPPNGNSNSISGHYPNESTEIPAIQIPIELLDAIDKNLVNAFTAFTTSKSEPNQKPPPFTGEINSIVSRELRLAELETILTVSRQRIQRLEAEALEGRHTYQALQDRTSHEIARIQGTYEDSSSRLALELDTLARENDALKLQLRQQQDLLLKLQESQTKQEHIDAVSEAADRERLRHQSELNALKDQLFELQSSFESLQDVAKVSIDKAETAMHQSTHLAVSLSENAQVEELNKNNSGATDIADTALSVLPVTHPNLQHQLVVIRLEAKVQALTLQLQSVPPSLAVAHAEKRVAEARYRALEEANDARLKHLQAESERRLNDAHKQLQSLRAERTVLAEKVRSQGETIHQLTLNLNAYKSQEVGRMGALSGEGRPTSTESGELEAMIKLVAELQDSNRMQRIGNYANTNTNSSVFNNTTMFVATPLSAHKMHNQHRSHNNNISGSPNNNARRRPDYSSAMAAHPQSTPTPTQRRHGHSSHIQAHHISANINVNKIQNQSVASRLINEVADCLKLPPAPWVHSNGSYTDSASERGQLAASPLGATSSLNQHSPQQQQPQQSQRTHHEQRHWAHHVGSPGEASADTAATTVGIAYTTDIVSNNRAHSDQLLREGENKDTNIALALAADQTANIKSNNDSNNNREYNSDDESEVSVPIGPVFSEADALAASDKRKHHRAAILSSARADVAGQFVQSIKEDLTRVSVVQALAYAKDISNNDLYNGLRDNEQMYDKLQKLMRC